MEKISLKQLDSDSLEQISFNRHGPDSISDTDFAKALDNISPTFCVAKWKQTTLHLQNGHTQSCHHPATHKVPWQELINRPSALHNTHYKMKMRDQMKHGFRPRECEYCWRVEDARKKETDALSDRYYKSRDFWATKYIPEILKNDSTADIPPSYLEVSFSNVCNFKCMYCAPHISSKWMQEVKSHGPYPTSGKFNNLEYIERANQMPIPNNQPNKYVEAFWKWFPDIYDKLEVFRITGGEPFMSKDTIKVLEFLTDNPAPNMELHINSNFCIVDKLWERVMSMLKRLVIEKKIKKLHMYTSAEAYGAASEWIRFGMDYDKWIRNLEWYVMNMPDTEHGPSHCTIMSTVNALSLPSYVEFIKDIARLKSMASMRDTPKNATYGSYVLNNRLSIDFPYLRNPSCLSMFLFQRDMMPTAVKWLEDAKYYAKIGRFNDHEITKIDRLITTLKGDTRWSDTFRQQNEQDFVKYIAEYDKRRDTNFNATFPELKSFRDSIIITESED